MKTINNVYRNIAASILPQAVNILSNFILPVMIIGAYGSSINGLISTIKTIVSYISLVGAGISVATTQALYLPVAKGDDDTVKGMLRATSDLFNRCGFIYVFIVIIISFAYPFSVKEDIPFSTICCLILIVSISGASEFFVVGRCRSLLYANQKVYVCAIIQALSLLAGLILAVVMLNFKFSIIFVQLGISFVYIIRAVYLYIYVKKNYPQYNFNKTTPPILTAIEKRKDAMIHQLSGLLVFGSQSIILSSLISFEAASIYAIYNVIFSGILSICANINVAVTPFLGKSLSLKTKDKVSSEFSVVEYFFYFITSFVFMVCVVTILPFVELYTKNADTNYIYPLFSLLFVFVFVFNVFRLPHSALINSAGMFKETRNRAIIESCICVVCSLIFTFYYGICGVLIGTGIAIVWRCLDMLIYVHKHILEDSVKLSCLRLCRTLFYVALFAYFFTDRIEPITNYWDWVCYALKISVAAFFILLADMLIFELKMLNLSKAMLLK